MGPWARRRGRTRRKELTAHQQPEAGAQLGYAMTIRTYEPPISGSERAQALYKELRISTTPMTAGSRARRLLAALPRPARICRQYRQDNLDSLQLGLYRSFQLSLATSSYQHVVFLWFPVNTGGVSLLPPRQWLPIALLCHCCTRRLKSQVDHNRHFQVDHHQDNNSQGIDP